MALRNMSKEDILESLEVCKSCVASQGKYFDENGCAICTDEGALSHLPRLRKEKAITTGLITRDDTETRVNIEIIA